MTNPTPPADAELSSHTAGTCPVCSAPLHTTRTVHGHQAEVCFTDDAVLEHLAGHDPREVAFALLVTEARYLLASSVGIAALVPERGEAAARAPFERATAYVDELAAQRREHLRLPTRP